MTMCAACRSKLEHNIHMTAYKTVRAIAAVSAMQLSMKDRIKQWGDCE